MNISTRNRKNGYKYNNIYQSGYFLGNMSLNDGKYDFEEFTELDRDFDFYTSQTFRDEKQKYTD
jgi:beta-fructofuranosidase